MSECSKDGHLTVSVVGWWCEKTTSQAAGGKHDWQPYRNDYQHVGATPCWPTTLGPPQQARSWLSHSHHLWQQQCQGCHVSSSQFKGLPEFLVQNFLPTYPSPSQQITLEGTKFCCFQPTIITPCSLKTGNSPTELCFTQSPSLVPHHACWLPLKLPNSALLLRSVLSVLAATTLLMEFPCYFAYWHRFYILSGVFFLLSLNVVESCDIPWFDHADLLKNHNKVVIYIYILPT